MSQTSGDYAKCFFEVDLLIGAILKERTGFSHVLLGRLSIVLTPLLRVKNAPLVSSGIL